MTERSRLIARFGIVVVAAACSTVILLALFNWAMTERFYLAPSWTESLSVSAVAIGFCAVGSLIFLAIMSLVNRLRPITRWAAAALGGTLFWLAPSMLAMRPGAGLLTLPAGVIVGLLLWRSTPNAVRQPAIIALSCGLLIWLTLLVIPAAEAWRESKLVQQPARKSLLGSRVMGGATLGPDLWLFNQSGKAVSFRFADWQPTLRARSGVAALATGGSSIWALLAPPFDWRLDHQPAARFRLASFVGGRWLYSPWKNYAVDERPLALVVGRTKTIILGPKRLYFLQRDGTPVTTRPLSIPIEAWGQFVATVIGPDTMYVGINRGEWGGGLRRINLATGEVAPVDRRGEKHLCSGPLSTECDPVTGLIVDPNKPNCVFASVGLSHMMWHGRVLRVCGDRVETVFEAQVLPIGKRIERALSRRAREFPPQSEPVFALAPAPGGFWAVTPRALYRWERGKVDRHRFPDLKQIHGLAVSQSIPGLVIVTTDANAAVSLSGFTPLVFAAKKTPAEVR